MATTADMDFAAQWTPILRGEVDVVFLPVQAAWPHLEASGGGSIVNFASVNAFRGSGTFGMVAHCAGKSAVLGLTRQLAVEGGPSGIRANTISPGIVRTPAIESAGAHDGVARETLLARIPLRSRMSCGEGAATRGRRRAFISTRPSCSRSISASRTGVRLVSNRRDRSTLLRSWPGSSRPSMMPAPNHSAICATSGSRRSRSRRRRSSTRWVS